MRRITFALLALLLSATLAPAADDFFHLSVATCGAVPGDGRDDTPNFQLAHDTLATRGSALRRTNPTARNVFTVTIPQATTAYEIAGTIWADAPFITWQGDGEGSCLSTGNTNCRPVFLFGLRRRVEVQAGIPKALVADATYRPDLFGKLDATAAPAKGQRWGFRSNGDSFIQAQATPLDAGGRGPLGTADNWQGVKALTLELAVEAPDGGKFPGGIPLACMGDPGGVEIGGPWTLHSGDTNGFVFQFSTQARPFGPKTKHRLDFSTGAAVGPQRLTVQLDLAAGTAAMFGNGKQVGSATFTPGLSLAENDFYPLLIGDAGGARPSLGNVGHHDANWYGLIESRTLRYRTDGIGTAQRRVDAPALPPSDRYRYFTPRDPGSGDYDPGTLAYLDFSDNPAGNGRTMTVRHGQAAEGWGVSSAFLIHSLQTVPGGIAMNALRDLRVTCGGHYGQGVAIGQNLDFKMERCRIENAYHAVGALSNGAAYFIDISDCYLQGSDSGIFGNSWIANLNNVRFPSAGRATTRWVGSNVYARNLFVGQWSANNQTTASIHSGDYGGLYRYDSVIVDYEGEGYARGPVYCEKNAYGETSLRLSGFNLGTVGATVPLVTLKDLPFNRAPARLMVDDVVSWGPRSRVVAGDAGWSWSIANTGLAAGEAATGPVFTPLPVDPNQPINPGGAK